MITYKTDNKKHENVVFHVFLHCLTHPMTKIFYKMNIKILHYIEAKKQTKFDNKDH